MSEQKTIAELYGLHEDDPWDRRTQKQKDADTEKEKQRAEWAARPDPEPVAFVDPPDTESWVIDATPESLSRYHRIRVPDHKLSTLVALDSSLDSIVVIAKANCTEGCWVAVNSLRLANRIARTLRQADLLCQVELVSAVGDVIEDTTSEEDLAAVMKAFGG